MAGSRAGFSERFVFQCGFRPRGLMIAASALFFALLATEALGALNVVSIQPARHALTVPIKSSVSVEFDQPVMVSTVNDLTFQVYGRWSGSMRGSFSFSNNNRTVTLTPNRKFQSGDLVTVILSNALKAADNSNLRSAGFSYQYWTRTRPANMNFTPFATFSNRGATPQTRIYGALAADLNSDGFPDLTTVNEVSEDVRVFMNLANGTGSYGPFLTPFPISFEASPNESADFNRDGKVDACMAATGTNSVWVLLGNGDGTFQSPGQEISVADAPHGIAVLDMNGDGAPDIATSNTGGNNVSIMLNNGSGVFGASTSFDSGGNGEYALGSGDMNNDGIMDLVVGAIFSQEVVIHRGNGNGTFTEIGRQDADGSVWMISCGELNGDGKMDVSTANSSSNTGSILLGNGAGGLGAAALHPMANHVVATDLGDLDGDGDLDWTLSAFGGSIWKVYKNNGAGVFAFDQQFSATSNPSCSILLDLDQDRDLDLALTDEIADTISLRKNAGTNSLGNFDFDADVDSADFAALESCYSGSGILHAAGCGHGDFDGDGDVDCADAGSFEDAWTAGGNPPQLQACAAPIPAASQWGLLVLALTTLLAGMLVLHQQTRAEK